MEELLPSIYTCPSIVSLHLMSSYDSKARMAMVRKPQIHGYVLISSASTAQFLRWSKSDLRSGCGAIAEFRFRAWAQAGRLAKLSLCGIIVRCW